MTSENVWMVSMVAMFGLFLIGVWVEARRSLRALAEDDFGAAEVKECEADYQTVMARIEARTRLTEMRESTQRHISQNSYNHNSYNLG